MCGCNLNSKKAEIGTTMTWLIATVVIVIMMMIFLFAASSLASFKKAGIEGSNFLVSSDYKRTNQSLNTKSVMAYLVTSDKASAQIWADKNNLNLGVYIR